MLSTAPISTGASLQRALREIVSVSSRRLIAVSSSTRRSSLCQEAFSSSSSMFVLRVQLRSRSLSRLILVVRLVVGEPEDLGDLGERTLFEIEQQHGAIERSLRVDEAAQDAAAVVGVELVADGRFVQLGVVGNGSPAARRFGAQPGNRDVERDAIQPGRKAALRGRRTETRATPARRFPARGLRCRRGRARSCSRPGRPVAGGRAAALTNSAAGSGIM